MSYFDLYCCNTAQDLTVCSGKILILIRPNCLFLLLHLPAALGCSRACVHYHFHAEQREILNHETAGMSSISCIEYRLFENPGMNPAESQAFIQYT